MLLLSLGTPYVVNPSAMVDAMGHEQWMEWQAFDSIYPLAHQSKMQGLIAHMLMGPKQQDAQTVTMPWVNTAAPTTAEERDASTAAALAGLPGHLTANARTTAGEFVL